MACSCEVSCCVISYINFAVFRSSVVQLCMCKYQVRNKLVVVNLILQVGGDGAPVTGYQFCVLTLDRKSVV